MDKEEPKEEPKEISQIKEETEEELEEELKEPLKVEEPTLLVIPPPEKTKTSNLEDDLKILTSIEVTDAVPTTKPFHPSQNFVLYVSGTTYRLYVYDNENSAWRYANLNITLGLTTTKTVRNAAGDGTCTLIFTKGLLTGGTC